MTLNLNQAKFTPASTTTSRTLGTIIGGRLGFNVLDFGADPTGVNDSVGAFEAAMMAAGGNGGMGRISIPIGNYTFSRPCNLDIMNTRTPGDVQSCVHFIGEGHTLTRFGNVGSGSNISGPNNDYAFKSTDGNGNQFNNVIWENLYIGGYGGIYIFEGSPTVRNCAINCWRGIVLADAGSAMLENLIIRSFNGTTIADPNLGQVGIFLFTDNASIRNVDARGLVNGTAIAVGGSCVTMEAIHCEVCRVAVMLGFAPTDAGGGPFLTSFSLKQFIDEACLIGIYANNASYGEICQVHVQGHQDPFAEGEEVSFTGLYVNALTQCNVSQIQSGGGFSQAALVTSASSFPASNAGGVYNNNIFSNIYPIAAGDYPIGTTVIPIARTGTSVGFPNFLVPGIKVTSAVGSQIPANTTVAATNPGVSVTLSHALTASMHWDVNNGGDALQFSDVSNNPLGGLDINNTLTPSLAPI